MARTKRTKDRFRRKKTDERTFLPPPRKRTRTGAPCCESYDRRNSILRRMGFKSYGAYLESALWREIRSRAFREHGRVCEGCGEAAESLHHSDYSEETLKGLNISGLVPVCGPCHRYVECTKNGKKRSLADANRVLESLCRRRMAI